MSEEYSDRFQSEVIQTLHKLVAKSIDHDQKFEALGSQIAEVAVNLKTLSGQFSDVGVMAIKDHSRVDSLEKRVDELEAGVH